MKSAKRSFDEHDIREKTGCHKYRRNIERIQGSKKREGSRWIRMQALIVTLDTIIAVHTPTVRPKVLHFVLVSMGYPLRANTDAIVTKYSFTRPSTIVRERLRCECFKLLAYCW